MTNVNGNDSASKSAGLPGPSGSNFLRGVLLSLAGVSRALAAAAGDSSVEDASPAWHASAVCGLSGGGRLRGGGAPINFEDPLSGEYSSPPIDEYYSLVKQLNDMTSLSYPASGSPPATEGSDDLHVRHDLRMPKIYTDFENIRYADLPVRLVDLSTCHLFDFNYEAFIQSDYRIGTQAECPSTGSEICADKLSEYSLTPVDWTEAFGVYAGSARRDEWRRLKYGYASATNSNWTIGAHVSF
jgi:hypothetical protein